MIVRYRLRILGLVSVLSAGACSDPQRTARAGQDSDGVETEAALPRIEVDIETVFAEILTYKERLKQVTGTPERAETHAEAASVVVWTTPEAEQLFASIDPMDPGQAISFEAGTTFVKEHFDPDGVMFGINVMYKGPEGYAPDNGDWVWLRVRGDELTHEGRIDFCQECHAAAINSDFVVGFGKSE